MPDSVDKSDPDSQGRLVDADAFWTFSLAIYGKPEVADLCLALQDMSGTNVNLVLFCCWIAEAFEARINHAGADRLIGEIQPWEDDVVQPLRRIRRTMKGRLARMPSEHRAQLSHLREAIKRTELDAEHIEQRLLALAWPERLAPATRTSPEPAAAIARANIGDYMAAAGLALPADRPELVGELVGAVFAPPATPIASKG